MKKIKNKFLNHFKSIIYITFIFDLMKIRKLKNIHKGEKVYIVADSAELRFFDLKKFDDAPMICFNFSWLIDDIYYRKSPLYAHYIEPYFFTCKSKLSRDTRKYLTKRIKNGNLTFFTSLSNRFSLNGKNIFHLFQKIPFDKLTKSLYEDENNFMLWSGSTAISLAVFMGFKEAFLIGFSNHSNSYVEHWYSKNLTLQSPNLVNYLRNDLLYKFYFDKFTKYIEMRSILTSDVEDCYLEYVIYKDITFTDPSYKKNSEMTDFYFLKLMEIENLYIEETIF